MSDVHIKQKETISSIELTLQNYNKFFQTIIKDSQQSHKTLLQSLPLETLHYHKAQILSHSEFLTKKLSKFNDIYLSVSKQFQNGLAYEYDLVMGYFYMRISMINFDRNADENSQEMETLGSGGFGLVRMCRIEGKEVAVKRIRLKQKIDKNQQANGYIDLQQWVVKYQQIRKAIREYGIYKICSMLEIGPRIMFNQTFDIHCYNDCIEFYMQLCEVPMNSYNFFAKNELEYEKVEYDLKKSLWKMHQVKLVHKDIKPENVLYSVENGKFVLTDFGLTHTVQAQIWQSTLTGYSGTLKYSSPQMISVYEQKKPSFVNLYYNDIYALTRVLIQFKQISKSNSSKQSNNNNNSSNKSMSNEECQQQYNQNQISRNSMSFAQSYSQHYSYRMGSEEYVQERSQEEIEQVRVSVNGLGIRTGSSNSSAAPTGSSIPILSTNDTNSLINPTNKSSIVNFYFAHVLYFLFKKHSISNPLQQSTNQQELIQTINNCIGMDIDKTIKEQVRYRVSWQLFPQIMPQRTPTDDSNCYNLQLYQLIRQLVFRLRAYGPQNPQTIQILKLIQELKTKRNNNIRVNAFYLQVKQHIQQCTKTNIIDSKQFEIDTILHKTINPMRRLKQLLGSINFKLGKGKLKADRKLFSTVALQYMKARADGGNILLDEDIQVFNNEMSVFLQSYYISTSQQRESNKMLKKLHPYMILNSLQEQQQFIETQIDQYQRQSQQNYFKEMNITFKIIKSIISITTKGFNNNNNDDGDNSENDLQSKSQLFLIIKYIFYLSLKQFNNQHKAKNQIFQLIQTYTKHVVQDQIEILITMKTEEINNIENKVDQLLKDMYFLVKVKVQAKKNYLEALQILQSLNELREELRIKSQKIYRVYCQGIRFYSDFLIDLQITICLRLRKFKQGQQLVHNYLISLVSNQVNHQPRTQSQIVDFTRKSYQELTALLSKLFPSSMIQKIHLLKKLADIKLRMWKQEFNDNQINQVSQEMMIRLNDGKQIYYQCIKWINLLYNWTQHSTLMMQIINNLVITLDQLNDWNCALEWCVYCYQLLNNKSKQITIKYNHLFHITNNFISLMLKYELIQPKTYINNYNYSQQTQINYHKIYYSQRQLVQQQLKRKYNRLLPSIITVYIKSKIQAMLRYSIFKNLQHEQFKLNYINMESNTCNIEIDFFNFKSNSKQQLLLLKQMFLIAYQQNMPHMEWNHRQLSLQLSREYSVKQHHTKKSIQYLWNYVANLFLNPSLCDSKDFQHMTNFVEMLIKERLEKRAFILIKKFVYYLPSNDFILRKRLYLLWIRTCGDLYLNALKSSSLEMRWVKSIAKNDFKLFKTRHFEDFLFQQLEHENYYTYTKTIFQSTLYKKWIKKL